MRKVTTLAVLTAGLAAVTSGLAAPGASADPGPGQEPPFCPVQLGSASQAVTAAANVGADGHATVFAGAASTQQGPLTYHFDFGDGTSADQSTPIATHTYGYDMWKFGLQVTVTGSSGGPMSSAVCRVGVYNVKNSVQRHAGDDRYQTSTAVSQWVWADKTNDTTQRRQAKAVVLASGAGFADALAGVPLATYKQGPLLLTEPAALSQTTEDEIKRVLPQGSTVYLLGGPSALSPAIASKLASDGYSVTRYGGADRYGTAMQIATRGLDNPASAIVVTGSDFADALAAGPVATSDDFTVDGKPAAIVLTDGDKVSDRATAAFITARLAKSTSATKPTPVFALGGPAYCAVFSIGGGGCIPAEVAQFADNGQISAGGASGYFDGLIGSDRYHTAGEAAYAYTTHHVSSNEWIDPIFQNRFGLASGTGFPDALTGGAAMATLHSPIFLTERDDLPAGSTKYLGAQLAGSGLTAEADIFGGPVAVSPALEQQLTAQIVR